MSKATSGQFDPSDDKPTESAPLHVEGFGLKGPLVPGGKGTENVSWKEVPKVMLGHFKTIVLGITGLPHDLVDFARTALQGLTRTIKDKSPLDASYERRVRDTRMAVDRDLEERERRRSEQIMSRGATPGNVLPDPRADAYKAECARRWIIDLIEKKRRQGYHASLRVTDDEQIIIIFVREGMESVAIELAGYTLTDAESIIDESNDASADADDEDVSEDDDDFLEDTDDGSDDADPYEYPHNEEDRD